MFQTAQRYAMMMQLSRVGKRSRHYYSHFICSSSTLTLSPRSARCRIINPSTYNHPRWSSGSSSNNNNTNNAITTVAENNSTKRRRHHRRKKQSFSPLLQITSNHPKNTNPPHPSLFNNTSTSTTTTNDIKLLTRKQLLRLTPKQRSNLHRHRLQQHKDSMSYLQQARTNVRSNLNYLGDTAGSNFKKNIKTIHRYYLL